MSVDGDEESSLVQRPAIHDAAAAAAAANAAVSRSAYSLRSEDEANYSKYQLSYSRTLSDRNSDRNSSPDASKASWTPVGKRKQSIYVCVCTLNQKQS